MHEIRNSVDPLVRLGERIERRINEAAEPNSLIQDIRLLTRQSRHIADMARADLRFIQSQRRAKLNLASTLRRVVKLLSSRARDLGVVLDLQPIPPLNLFLPPVALEQPLLNLLDNALHYSASKDWGRIRIRAELANPTSAMPLAIVIEDEGLGMTAEQVDSLFTPGLSAKGEQGFGLGIYVSRNLLRSVGGDLILESTIRWCGSRFVIRLPWQATE